MDADLTWDGSPPEVGFPAAALHESYRHWLFGDKVTRKGGHLNRIKTRFAGFDAVVL